MSSHQSDRQGILAVGNLLTDKMKSVSEFPRESMLAHIVSESLSCGGGCLNILFDLAKMNDRFPLAVAGVVGNDNDGNFILEQCREKKIDCSNVNVDAVSATSYTDVFINRVNGNRTFFHHSGANEKLDIRFVESLTSQAKIAHLAYLLVLPQLDKYDEEYGSVGAKALSLLRDLGMKTSLDLVSDSNVHRYEQWVKPALRYVDYLIINDEEAYSLTGFNRTKGIEIYQEMAESLLNMGVNDTVIIHYPEGATGIERGQSAISVPAYTVEKQNIVSTLGAGDAFCAGVLYGLHENQSLQYSMKLGCACAHFNLFSLSATGAAPSYEKLHELIHKQQSN